MEFMAKTPDKYYELAIVDPPYGIGVSHNMGRRQGDLKSDYKPAIWDNRPPNEKYFKELFRISQNQIIWGANHFMHLINKSSSCWIVWDKLFSNNVSFASCELAWTSFSSVIKKYAQSSARKDGIHPTQKPVALYKWLLTNYAKKGDKIIDTHGGSGSICIACHDLGFDLDWMELDADYYAAAVKRYDEHAKQQFLFDPRET
jgi:site-specific DNA-methyltransferase (adenine-specific)